MDSSTASDDQTDLRKSTDAESAETPSPKPPSRRDLLPEDAAAALLLLGRLRLPQPAEQTVTEPIDFDVVSGWVTNCEEYHEANCSNGGYQDPSDRETRILLVDVQENCIVEATLNYRYAALSYVWGGVQQLHLLTSNAEELKKPGSLELDQHRKLVPRTIQDAMVVVRRMKERYLWVDTMCIVQDDLPKKQIELMRMAAIYSLAAFTIVACTGEDADSPLPGVSPDTRLPGRLDVSKLTKNDADQLRRFVLDKLLEYTPHAARAWTFQEVILSKRCLFFFGNRLYFKCLTSQRHEAAPQEVEHGWTFGVKLEQDASWPPDKNGARNEFQKYANMVNDFTKRDLSFAADREHAMQGLLKALGTAWKWQFFYALPTCDWHLSLYWVGLDFSTRDWGALDALPEHEREEWAELQMGSDAMAGARSWKATGPLTNFPSWSWLSHPGAAMYPLFIATSCSIKWLVVWEMAVVWDGEMVRLLVELEVGKPDDQPPPVFRGCPPGTLCFTALTVPLAAVPPLEPGSGTAWFDAHRAAFRAAGKIYTPLVNAEGQWYGTLIGAAEERLRELIEGGAKLTLVRLSCSPLPWVLDRSISYVPYDATVYPTANWATFGVMLVARGEHTCTRLAIGEVHQDEWFKLEQKDEMILLA